MVREIALVNWQRGAGWEEENPGGGRTGHFSALQDGIASALALHYSMVSKTFPIFPFCSEKRASTHPLGDFYTKSWKQPGWCGMYVWWGRRGWNEQPISSEARSEGH